MLKRRGKGSHSVATVGDAIQTPSSLGVWFKRVLFLLGLIMAGCLRTTCLLSTIVNQAVLPDIASLIHRNGLSEARESNTPIPP